MPPPRLVQMSQFDQEMREHRKLLLSVIDEHRDGRGAFDDIKEGDDLVLEEEPVYPPIDALRQRIPPTTVQGAGGWIYHSTSFGFLKVYHFPRKLAINIVEAPLFDPLILITIMANCTTMAWTSPLDADDPTLAWKAELLGKLEWVYLYIFTFELCSKMLAYGIVMHQHSYLRDAWCQLDFIVVSLAWLPILFPAIFGNMSAIRSVRALRPLRALKRVPGMPVLVGSILQAIPALGSVAGLTGFFFLIFAIVGMALFKGVLHYRCDEAGEDSGEFCDMEQPDSCYVDGLAVPGRTCKYFDENPDGGTISFDNVALAMLPVLQAITFDTWTSPVCAAAHLAGRMRGRGSSPATSHARPTRRALLLPLAAHPFSRRCST